MKLSGNSAAADEGSAAKDYKRKTNRLSLNYMFWCLVWAVCIMVSDYTIEANMLPDLLIWPMLLLPVVLTPFVFYQYYQYYRGVDELTRKIQSDALAIGFAIGMLVLVLYMSLANIGVEEPGANETFAIFAIASMIGQVVRTVAYNR